LDAIYCDRYNSPMRPFSMARVGELHFGAGALAEIPVLLSIRGWTTAVVVISRSALADSETREGFLSALGDAGVQTRAYRYDRKPDGDDPFTAARGEHAEASPDVVDAIVAADRSAVDRGDFKPAQVVIAIGGGSAVDTGKAVSAAFCHDGSIADYLEGVGTRSPSGDKLPFLAVPTTAGTGSEATKNAVLCRPGDSGFKKSLRHDSFVPDVAVIDPQLQLRCPAEVTGASGMDAIAQLLESYLSTGATPLTDAYALDGLAAAGRSFVRAVQRGDTDLDARAGMAYAAYLSGLCLANAALGVVHGMASPAGAFTTVPHGVFCGALLPEATDMLVSRLVSRRDGMASLVKLATAGRVLAASNAGSLEANIQLLIDRLRQFRTAGSVPGLAAYGFTPEVIRRIAEQGNNKASPVEFGLDERVELLERCLA
jgi:alcohol dehydrogenase